MSLTPPRPRGPRRRSRAGLAMFLGAAVLALAGGGWWIARDSAREAHQAKAAAAHPPVLPAGRLQALRGSVTEVRYLALDEVRSIPGGVAATVLTVAKTPTGLEGGHAFSVKRESVDCAARRVFEGQAGDFDADGRLVSATNIYSGERGRPLEASDVEQAPLCDRDTSGHRVAGWRGAQRDVQALPEGYEAFADAHPDDPVAWARMCAAAARGRWRPQAPRDCDRAVRLNPDAPDVRLDRGFLALVTGHNAAAAADFRAVAARWPDVPEALVGKSLVEFMAGDRAAGRADHDRARALDPRVADWIETTFRFRISDPYR